MAEHVCITSTGTIISFVIPIVFIINYNGVNLLSNTTIWWRDVYILYYLLHREQLHVSALDNGHLQVVHESLSKQLYKQYTYLWATYMGKGGGVKGARDLVSVPHVQNYVHTCIYFCSIHNLVQPEDSLICAKTCSCN